MFESLLDLLQRKLASERGVEGCNLAILDDFFPGMLSSFRIAEYNYYLEKLEAVKVFSTAVNFSRCLREYASVYPYNVKSIFRFNPKNKVSAKLCYLNFLNNAYIFIDYIEKQEMPFVFTLYPGGGFQLKAEDSDSKLRRVLGSKFFRRVITTQPISKDYLIEGNYCRENSIQLVNGLVVPADRLNTETKLHYPVDKPTFDICFVAHKYMRKGVDKGYDTFVHVAKKLAAKYDFIKFHVVGNFDEKDLDIACIETKITFYGTRHTDFFASFYRRMDIIVSPNIPFALAPGAFDGFPTGCCVEAGLCGVAVFSNDKLGQNLEFIDNEDIVILPDDIDEVCKKIDYFLQNTKELYALSAKGQHKFNKIYDMEFQMQPRLDIIREYLGR